MVYAIVIGFAVVVVLVVVIAQRANSRMRYRCKSCGNLQADGAWEKAMDVRAKAQGMRGFHNISANPECIKCGSSNLEDIKAAKASSPVKASSPISRPVQKETEEERLEREKVAGMADTLVRLYSAGPTGSRGQPIGFTGGTEQSKPIEEIGEELNRMNGIKTMRMAAKIFCVHLPECARNLDMVWDGIGEWRG